MSPLPPLRRKQYMRGELRLDDFITSRKPLSDINELFGMVGKVSAAMRVRAGRRGRNDVRGRAQPDSIRPVVDLF
jgi:hypothetical protein